VLNNIFCSLFCNLTSYIILYIYPVCKSCKNLDVTPSIPQKLEPVDEIQRKKSLTASAQWPEIEVNNILILINNIRKVHKKVHNVGICQILLIGNKVFFIDNIHKLYINPFLDSNTCLGATIDRRIGLSQSSALLVASDRTNRSCSTTKIPSRMPHTRFAALARSRFNRNHKFGRRATGTSHRVHFTCDPSASECQRRGFGPNFNGRAAT